METNHDAVIMLCSLHHMVFHEDEWVEVVEGFDTLLDAFLDSKRLLIADVYCPVCNGVVQPRLFEEA